MFQGVNRPIVLSFEGNAHQTRHIGYILPKLEIKDSNVIFDVQNFSDQPIMNDQRTHHNIKKVTKGEGDNYKTVCLLDYAHFKKDDTNRFK